MSEAPTTTSQPAAITLRPYLIGVALALALTLASFALVVSRALTPRQTLLAIATLGAVQMLVHLRFFLHMGWRRTPFDVRLAVALAAILMLLMVGGTLLVMGDLDRRMLPSA